MVERFEAEACECGDVRRRELRIQGKWGQTLALLLMSRFAMVSTGWKISSSAIPAQHHEHQRPSSPQLQPTYQTCPNPTRAPSRSPCASNPTQLAPFLYFFLFFLGYVLAGRRKGVKKRERRRGRRCWWMEGSRSMNGNSLNIQISHFFLDRRLMPKVFSFKLPFHFICHSSSSTKVILF